jgi:hypothetical protein
VTEVQRADPAARRLAVVLVVAGALVGSLLIAGLERYRAPLYDWILSDPQHRWQRLRLLFLLSTGVLSVPLLGFAAYLWMLGGRVVRAQRWPPPGQRVVRDTPVLHGRAAVWRGRTLRVLAACLGAAWALLWLLSWRLASMLGQRAA